MVREVNMMDIMEQLAAIADDVPDPSQAEASKLDDDSKISNDVAIKPSGGDSSESLDPFQEKLSHELSGGPASDTSADSDQTTSEASLPINS